MVISESILSLCFFHSIYERYSLFFYGNAKTFTRNQNGFQCLLFGITLDPENVGLGVMCMLFSGLYIYFKTYVSMMISYCHRFLYIVRGHIFFAWIIISLDNSDNDLIIISDIPFVRWELTPTNTILLPWHEHSAIHLFSLNILLVGMIYLHLENVLLTQPIKVFPLYSFNCHICLMLMGVFSL